MRLTLPSLFLLLGVVPVIGCATTPPPPPRHDTAGELLDDATVTTKVNALIVADPDAHFFRINVTTTRGEVVLEGFVNTRDAEGRLIAKVRDLAGVRSVKSLLQLERPVAERGSR
jgi:hyperosmotically inducible periplasmic protein